MCVKWPNDIYYQDQVKLGGILVTTFSGGGTSDPTTAIIGEKMMFLLATYNYTH